MGVEGSRHWSPITVETDTRSRVSLKQLGVPEHRQFIASVDEDGTVVLSPAVTISEAEARFLRNPDVVARIEDNRQHPERLRGAPYKWRGSCSIRNLHATLDKIENNPQLYARVEGPLRKSLRLLQANHKDPRVNRATFSDGLRNIRVPVNGEPDWAILWEEV